MEVRQESDSDGTNSRFDWSIGLYEELTEKSTADDAAQSDGHESMLEPLPLSRDASIGDDDGEEESLSPSPHIQELTFEMLPPSEYSSSSGRSRRKSTIKTKRPGAGSDPFFSKSASRRKKKPTGTPKRPLSAYNCYFREERARLMQARSDNLDGLTRLASGKISFVDLGRHIGAKWNNLSFDARRVYKNLAALDVERYRREMEEFEKEHQRRKKVKMDDSKLPPMVPDNAGSTSPHRSTSSTTRQDGFSHPADDAHAHFLPHLPYTTVNPSPTELPPDISMLAPGTGIVVPDRDGVGRHFVVNYCLFMATPEEASQYLAALPTGYAVAEGAPPAMPQPRPYAASYPQQRVDNYSNYCPLPPHRPHIPWPPGPPPPSYDFHRPTYFY